MTSIIFNQSQLGADKIGYVVDARSLKMAIVACKHLVYFPKYNMKVSRVARYFTHDEDCACVEGDLVHIRLARKISKYKHYYVFSILDPNIEGRERRKHGLPAVSPPLFGYPHCRRVVKLNMTNPENTKEKLAAVLQEQVQEFFRYGGRVSDTATERAKADGSTFEEVSTMIAPNQPPSGSLGEDPLPTLDASGHEYNSEFRDDRNKKGEHFWANKTLTGDTQAHDFRNMQKSQ